LSESESVLQGHFRDLPQQHEASSLGMWVFLVTEIMFFGGMFLAYTVNRAAYPAAFAEASRELNVRLGAFNTAVLICSSLTMALAVRAAQTGKRRSIIVYLSSTMALGAIFLAIKAVEYAEKFSHHLVPGRNFIFPGPYAAQAQLYFSLYFAMTGTHAVHMIIGEGILLVLLIEACKLRYTPEYNTPVEMTGLYWHFVDIVWIYLFPLLYLIDIHK
jgi:cytochrome c oxidase subunit III